MPLPNGFISELKARVSLEDTISRYVQLKRAGSNLVGCCPFHSEKTPSFTVFLQTDSFYCFGCGAGGDIITFVMRMENLDYMSAVEKLAGEAGMQIPQDMTPGRRENRERYYEMNKKAARFFHNKLISPEGKKGLEYLMEKRSLSAATIRKFGLGYAGESWDELCGFLMREGFTEEEITTGFLAGKSKRTGRVFDYFRGRVMFPIIDISGRVIAFGGRATGNEEPKYLNSSDTPVFKKRRNLYALNIAKDSDKDSVILCEGYMDVIALQAAGFTNAIASLGTALTEEQVNIIKRYASTVYICYDSDGAGRAATSRAIKILEKSDLKIKVLSLKGAKDPDEYIKKFGRDAFQKVIDGANGHIEYVFSEILEKYNLENPEDKLSFVKEIFWVLTKTPSSLEREIFLGRLHELTGIAPDILKSEFSKVERSAKKSEERRRINEDMQAAAGFGDRVNPDRTKYTFAASKEENALGILLLRSEYLADPKIRKRLSDACFKCEFNKRMLLLLLELTENGGTFDFGELGAFLTADEISAATKMMLSRKNLSDNSEKVLTELLDALDSDAASDNDTADLNEYFSKLKSKKQGK
ncbi:MAG: DNA primase [Firmicutes bacterium]|nr:DNA primase [Bacillota bacterium]